MSWTEDRVETLKKLWSEGLSASQIATKLGGVSRNAVIGKVHRLQLSSRGKVATPAQTRKASAKASVQTASKTVEGVENSASLAGVAEQDNIKILQKEAFANHSAVKEAIDPTGDQSPPSRRLTLLELTENTCKWPLGDPLSKDFHFCGVDSSENSPYCTYHSKIAFQVVSVRRRKAS